VLGKYLGLEEVEKDGRFYLAELYELVDGWLWDIIVEWWNWLSPIELV
jgi:hypothetical protein